MEVEKVEACVPFGSQEDLSGYDCFYLSCLETTGWQATHWRSHLPRSLAKNVFYVFQGLKKRGGDM